MFLGHRMLRRKNAISKKQSTIMKNLSFKKFLAFLNKRFYYERFVSVAFSVLTLIGVALIAVDIWVFYIYSYTVINTKVDGVSAIPIHFKKDELRSTITSLNSRVSERSRVLEGTGLLR